MSPIVSHLMSIVRIIRVAAMAIVLFASIPPGAADERGPAAQQQKIADRYLSLLKRNPRFGTALDKVYEFRTQRGTLDEFVTTLQDAATNSSDAAEQMIVGMIETKRDRHSLAVIAFRSAEKQRTDDPVASWYLGQALGAIGERAEAAGALERAIQRKPTRVDLLEIYQQLGRLYQRLQQPEKALQVWERMEAAFPDDTEVQVQIAEALVESGQQEAALERFQKLAKQQGDPYQRMQYEIRAAEIQLQLGAIREALLTLDDLSDQVKPSSWLFGDIRRRIEDVYRQTNDDSGLAAYFQTRLKRHPDDLDAMTRLAQCLTRLDRADEAEQWLKHAVEKAPSDIKLHDALIAHLVQQEKFKVAISQFEQLAKDDLATAEHIERWGLLYLQLADLPESQRQQLAIQVWQRLLASNETNAAILSRVAELHRKAKSDGTAIEFYEQAIAAAPHDLQYTERLGEYLHELNRPDDAKAAWQKMAVGEHRSSTNLVRLAETLQKFGYKSEALAAMLDACRLNPEFNHRLQCASMLRDAGRIDDSLQQLEAAEQQAASPLEHERAQQKRIQTFIAGDLLQTKIQEIAQRMDGETASAEQWMTLALYQEADSDFASAIESAQKAVRLSPQSSNVLKVVARVAEKAGLLTDAAEAYAKLAASDLRFQTVHLEKRADLLRRLGRKDSALEAGRQLLAAAPDNPQHYRFFADLCFQLGQLDAGLEALRQGVRINPTDVATLQAAGQALADRFRTDEAIEFYWRAFDAAEDVEQKIHFIQALTHLYLRSESFDKLVNRLQDQMRDEDFQKTALLCLANAYRTAGDPGMTRQTLERLLADDANNAALLSELSVLAEQQSEFGAAVKFQQRLHTVAPSSKSAARLANLLLRSGDIDSAEALWLRLSDPAADPLEVLQSIDDLILEEKPQIARRLANQVLERNPNDWEAILRLAVISWSEGNMADAATFSDQLLAMPHSVLSPSRSAQRRLGPTITETEDDLWNVTPAQLDEFSQHFLLLSSWTKMNGGRYRPRAATNAAWSAESFGQARATAVFLKCAHAIRTKTFDQFVISLSRDNSDDNRPAFEQALAAWDLYHVHKTLYYVAHANRDMATTLTLSALSKRSEPLLCFAFVAAAETAVSRAPSSPLGQVSLRLSSEQVGQLVEAFECVRETHPDWPANPQFVVQQLQAVGKTKEANEILDYLVRADATPAELSTAIEIASRSKDFARVLTLTSRLIESGHVTSTAGQANPLRRLGQMYAEIASQQSAKRDFDTVDSMLREFLRLKSAVHAAGAVLRGQADVPLSQFATGNYSIYVDGRVARTQNTTTLASEGFFTRTDLTFFVNLLTFYDGQPLSRLLSLIEDFKASQAGATGAMSEMAMAHLCFLADAREDAIVHLVRAAELMPEHAGLRLQIARYHFEQDNHAEALALLNTIESAAPDVVRERELLALELATTLGNTDRARTAAERLFGLRLPTSLAMPLATSMKKLGMDEMADALLTRVQRSAGNDVNAMAVLMRTSYGEGHKRIATEIAHQILTETEGRSQGSRQGVSLDGIRKSALRILGDSDRLKHSILRIEQQLARSPDSISLNERLLEYYVAVGRAGDAEVLKTRVQKLRPTTIDSLIRDAEMHEARGRFSEAADVYLQILDKDPQRYAQNYYQYLRTFRSGGRLTDLGDWLLKRDLKKLQNNYFVVSETIQTMLADDGRGQPAAAATRALALKLFEGAWQAFPDNRGFLISQVQDESIWLSDRALEFAKVGLIPESDQQAVARPWLGVAGKLKLLDGGHTQGTLNRLCNALESQDALAEFTPLVKTATEKFPSWHGGRLLLAALLARSGDIDQSVTSLESVSENADVKFVPMEVALVVVTELAHADSRLHPPMIALLETAAESRVSSEQSNYPHSATRWLAELYVKQDRRQDARRQIEQFLRSAAEDLPAADGPSYARRLNEQNRFAAAQHLLELGFPLHALRAFRQLRTELPPVTRRQVGNSQLTQNVVLQAELRAQRAITATTVFDFLADSLATDFKPTADDAEKAKDAVNRPAIDLMLSLQSRKKGEPATLHSAVLAAAREAGSSSELNEQQRNAIKQALSTAKDSESPLAVFAVVYANSAQDTELEKLAFDQLRVVVGTNLRQSDDRPHPDTALWFAAKVADTSKRHQSLAGELADRAERAAALSADPRWLTAILQERAERAIANGELTEAEQTWTRQLDAILNGASSTGEAANSTAPPSSALQELRKRLLNKRAG